jgi:RNA polymerase sigma-70 factor, ECF subfamily
MTSDLEIQGLAMRARSGDRDAFASIYLALAPRVLRYFRHQVPDDVAEELMQRTFLKVIEALPSYEARPGVPFGAWVFRIGRNLLIDDRRRGRPTETLDAITDLADGEATPFDLAAASIEREQVRTALNRLDDDAREVLLLRFFADLSSADAGAVMERTAGAVRVLQHRAIGRLRVELAEIQRGSRVPAVATLAASTEEGA